MQTRTTKWAYPTHLRTTAVGFLCGRKDAGNVGTFGSPEIVDCPDCRAAMNFEAPCAGCGGPTLRGVNSDFCSAACERSTAAEAA